MHHFIDRLDIQIHEILKGIRFHRVINPKNTSSIVDALRKGTYLPDPIYRIKADLVRAKQVELGNLKVKTGEERLDELYGHFLHKTDQKFAALLNLVENRPNTEIFTKIYGKPTESELKAAKLILKGPLHRRFGNRARTPEYLAEKFEKRLAKVGLNEWRVKIGKRQRLQLRRLGKVVIIPDNKKYHTKDISRLINHEIIHAIRAENASHAQAGIFLFGCPNYERTEEGLALCFEQSKQLRSLKLMKDYAARLLAVHLLIEGADYLEIYRHLQTYHLAEVSAMNATLRVLRGNGYTKDQIYLSGLIQMHKLLQDHGAFPEQLAAGKITYEQSLLYDDLVGESEKLVPLPKITKQDLSHLDNYLL